VAAFLDPNCSAHKNTEVGRWALLIGMGAYSRDTGKRRTLRENYGGGRLKLLNVRLNVGVGSQTRAFSIASITKVIARVNPER
jgi:hypothetical protein